MTGLSSPFRGLSGLGGTTASCPRSQASCAEFESSAHILSSSRKRGPITTASGIWVPGMSAFTRVFDALCAGTTATIQLRTSHRGQSPCEKLAAMAQPFLVDAVADAIGEVPFDRHAQRDEPARCMKQRLRRYQVVAVAMHEQDRRARSDL